jgi:rod shape-determining protein MreD
MIQRIDQRARRDAYGNRINRSQSPLLATVVPWMSIVLASIVQILPIASALPLMPPLGFLMLVGWRLVRPGLLPVWSGFPLGMVDDLFSGQPFGSAILLWSLAMLLIELVEARLPWRGFLFDWLLGGSILAAGLFAGALLSGAPLGLPAVVAMVPQVLLSILLFPIIARMVSSLDRLRLMRFRMRR